MNIHEHQAKELLRDFGVAVPNGIAAFSVDEAVAAAEQLGSDVTVVKAQIHAGGRGKAGGVKVVKSVADVKAEAERLLGSTLVTHQTGPAGKEVQRLYIEQGCDIGRELYLSMLVDRGSSQVTIIASTEGGMDIEAVAAETPEKILTVSIDPATGLKPHHVRSIANAMGLSGDTAKQASGFCLAFTKPLPSLMHLWWKLTLWWSPVQAIFWLLMPRWVLMIMLCSARKMCWLCVI